MDFTPFTVNVPQAELDDLRSRIAATRWPDQIPESGWNYGANIDFVRELLEYWANGFDWRKTEAELNAWPQYTTTIDGQKIHFIHVRSPHKGARPLVLLHGWPSTTTEFSKVIGPLSDPVSHGGNAEDAFDIVVPSLPGFGWSGPTREPGWHPGRIADAFAELLEGLGYDHYFVHGGDYGAVVAGQLALRHPERVTAIHLTFLVTGGRRPEDGEATPEEARLEADQAIYNATETGYLAIQATKPQSLAYGLNDSPAGLAAWIVEKFNSWTDNGGDLESVLTKDELLANITTYWLTQTAGSAARLYYETAAGGMMGPSAERVETPTYVAVFPKELYRTTRRIAEHHYNVQRWTEQPRGGHFAASEQPELLVDDIRSALRTVGVDRVEDVTEGARA
ncbi:epoxide hydrolase family protein [Arthrobacter mobilis]|uniref:Epoxide hydrolase n=1 Tax=Arthrobacter mobilis TaxID=2724944 RepID=A0A7X6K7G2_9MICC|nr:epoxide hydrolase family protein [Arthrobacter mobilis]NKX56563.1 epoxide hydrolase [Arthrobacter mobilis]